MQLGKLGLLFLAFLTFIFAAPTEAAIYTVTTTADSGAGSLRAMVTATNSSPTGSADTINFVIPTSDAGCVNGVCTITLSGGEIAIQKLGTSALTISGAGADKLILSGNNTNRVFTFTSGGVGSNVTLGGVKVTGGKSTYGGAIFANAGTFTISNSVFTGNTATGGSGGGAILCACTVNNTTFSNNTAPSGSGGAINGARTVANSIFNGNSAAYGGAIYASQVTSGGYNFSDSIFSGNSATGYGGAIYLDAGGQDFLSDLTLSGNSAVQKGGAIYEYYCSVHVADTTITNNSTSNGNGGGMSIYLGSFYFTNSTVSHNYSKSQGGGIYSYAPPSAYISHILNTIISNNTSTTTSTDYYGDFQSLGYNLVGNGTGATMTGTMTGNQIGTTAAPIDAKLSPLAYHGGFGLTRVLTNNSPAIDAGTTTGDANNVVPALDQRGAARVGATDIGACEVNTGYVATLPNGRTTLFYNSELVPDSGSFTYAVTSGSLPPGLGLTTALIAAGTVSISGTPTQAGTYNFTVTSSDGVNPAVTNYTLTILSPTAAGVSVGGRVVTANGRGIRNAQVRLTDVRGKTKTILTSTFGNYRFDNLAAGATYIVTAAGKRYTFSQPVQVVNASANVSSLNFIANP